MTDKRGTPSSQPTTVPPMSRRAMLITVATASLVILCVGGVFLFGGLVLVSLFSEPPLDVVAVTPPPVTVGEEYEVTLTITNTHDRSVAVTEIQMPFTILEGSDLESSSPAFSARTDYAGRYGYSFSINLDPGQSQTVILKMKALYAGDFSGEARVLSGTRAKTVALHVIVER